MIKGALILGVGFALGYAKAMQENDAVRDLALTIKDDFTSWSLQRDEKIKKDAVDSTATETPNQEEGDYIR